MKFLAGSSDAKGIKISDFAKIDLPAGGMINGIITDAGIMSQFFKQAAADHDLARSAAWLIINNPNINTKIVDIPHVGEDQALEFIKREITQYSEEETDEVFDFTVLNPKSESGGMTVLAVGVSRELLTSYRDSLASAGIELAGINLGLNCHIQLTELMPLLSRDTVILVWVDGRALTLTLFSNGEYRIQNRSRMVHSEDEPEWSDEISAGISTMIQFSKSQRSSEVVSAAFIAGVSTEKFKDLKGAISNLEIEIKPLDFASKVSLTGKASGSKDWEAGEYLLNIGNLIGKK